MRDASVRLSRDGLGRRAYFGDLKGVRDLLESGEVQANRRDSAGATALHAATFAPKNGREIMELLLDYKADINAQGNNGKTPLADAASPNNANPKALQDLLELGADPKIPDNNGQTPYDVASPDLRAIILNFTHRKSSEPYLRTIDSWQS